MATARQIELFTKLTQDRQFPPEQNVESLRKQFAEISDQSASAWIEKALTLPKTEVDGKPFTPPAF